MTQVNRDNWNLFIENQKFLRQLRKDAFKRVRSGFVKYPKSVRIFSTPEGNDVTMLMCCDSDDPATAKFSFEIHTPECAISFEEKKCLQALVEMGQHILERM